MTTLRTAAQQALEALENTSPLGLNMESDKKFFAAITALRAALAEPVPPAEAQTEAEKIAYCAGWWAALEKARKAEMAQGRKPLTVMDLQDALIYTNLIDPDAVNDPEGYDEGSTLAQIDALHGLLTGDDHPCNPHPKAPHSFMRNASHTEDRYVCECEGWEPYEAGYQAGMEAALRAQS